MLTYKNGGLATSWGKVARASEKQGSMCTVAHDTGLSVCRRQAFAEKHPVPLLGFGGGTRWEHRETKKILESFPLLSGAVFSSF